MLVEKSHPGFLLAAFIYTALTLFACRIAWTEELGGLQSTGHKESNTTERLHFHFHLDSLRYSEVFFTTNVANIVP